MAIDAIILSGGRGRRLGGADKGRLRIDGETLLDRAIAAVADCRGIVVAGPAADAAGRAALVREDPPFAGPAAAVVAAVCALPDPNAGDRVIVLACDLVRPEAVVAALRNAPQQSSSVLREGGRLQFLCGIHDAAALRRAVARVPNEGADASMRDLLAPLDPVPIDVAVGTTADIDTWADAQRAGVGILTSREAP